MALSVLFAVILRIPDERGSKIYKNIDEITQKLGESIKTSEYENYAVYPLGMELVEPDKKISCDIELILIPSRIKISCENCNICFINKRFLTTLRFLNEGDKFLEFDKIIFDIQKKILDSREKINTLPTHPYFISSRLYR